MTKDEALRLALEALTEIDGAVVSLLSSLSFKDPGPESPAEKVAAAIKAIRAALAAPAVVPPSLNSGMCTRCGKWAGAHATLPGQPRDHLCMCQPAAPAAPSVPPGWRQVAWGVFAQVDGEWSLQWPPRMTHAAAEDDCAHYKPGTKTKVLPVFAAAPTDGGQHG